MTLPEKTTYPRKYDTEYELKTVVDSLYSRLTTAICPYDPNDDTSFNWEEGEGQIELNDTSNWPDSGFVTVYLNNNFDDSKNRAALFHYGSIENTTLLNVTMLPYQSIKYFPEDSVVVQNVVAQNHNFSKDAILNLETYLGNRGTEDQSTIEWFADFFARNVRVPKPWLKIDNTVAFVKDYVVFKDLTTRIKPGFTPELDSTVKWIFQFGDGSETTISLDPDTEEYVFEISTLDSNNNVVSRTERKSSWNHEIYYAYQQQGIYTISLSVYNEFGSDSLTFVDVIKIIDEAPETLTLSIQGANSGANTIAQTRVKSLSDSVFINSNIENSSNLQVSRYIWSIPNVDSDTIPESPYLNLTFDVGGIYDIGLRVITTNDAWVSSAILDAIDVVEKPSVWLGYASKTSGNFELKEYAIKADTWKMNPSSYNLNYTYSFNNNPLDPSTDPSSLFRESKGFHAISNSDNAYLIWAISQRALNIAKYNSMNNSYSSELDMNYMKIFNWYTLYIPVYNSNKIYILGGLKDLESYEDMNQEIINYNISSNTFETIIQEFVLPITDDVKSFSYTTAYENAQSMIKNPNSLPAKWHSANFSGKGYVLRNSENNILEDLFQFDPSVNIFTNVNASIPFSKTELGFNALRDGIYVVSNKGDLFRYDPTTNIWNTTTSSSLDSYRESFNSSSNENAQLVSTTESRSISSSNTKLYFSYDYALDTFGQFDIETLSFSKLSDRPSYSSDFSVVEQWGMIKL